MCKHYAYAVSKSFPQTRVISTRKLRPLSSQLALKNMGVGVITVAVNGRKKLRLIYE